MKSYIETEFKRAFFSLSTLISILLVFIALFIAYYNDLKFPPRYVSGIDLFFRARNCLATSYLPLVSPIIACLPFANSYILDKEAGIQNYIYMKVKHKKYLSARLFVNALAGGLVLMIPQLIFGIYLILVKGVNNLYFESMDGAFSNVYNTSKIEYFIILIIISFIFGAVYSTFALGISTIANNKYLTIIIPFVYVIITGTIFELTGLNSIVNLNVIALFDISDYAYYTSLNLILYDIALFLIGAILLFYGDARRNV